jgi:hypothetical protein
MGIGGGDSLHTGCLERRGEGTSAVGQCHIVRQLRFQIAAGEMHHAAVTGTDNPRAFLGRDGNGKRSAGRLRRGVGDDKLQSLYGREVDILKGAERHAHTAHQVRRGGVEGGDTAIGAKHGRVRGAAPRTVPVLLTLVSVVVPAPMLRTKICGLKKLLKLSLLVRSSSVLWSAMT